MKENILFEKIQNTIDKTCQKRKTVRENLLQNMQGEKLDAAKAVLCGYGEDTTNSNWNSDRVTQAEHLQEEFYDCFDKHMGHNKIGAFYTEQICGAEELAECAKILGSIKMYGLLEGILKKQEFSWDLRECLIDRIFSFDEILSFQKSKLLDLYSMCRDSVTICLKTLPEAKRNKFLKIFPKKQQSMLREDLEFMGDVSNRKIKHSKREVFLSACQISKKK